MKYAIAGGHQATVDAAAEILENGGNAADAAAAAYLVSFVSEPCMASAGAGGFAIVKDGQNVQFLDFFCQTPQRKRKASEIEFYPVTVDFGTAKEDFYVGKGSVAVPGAIAGIYALHERFGKLPVTEIFDLAIAKTKDGIALDQFQADDLVLLEDIFGIDQTARDIFFNPDQQLKKKGQLIDFPHYADFLTALKHEGKDLFYKGDIAKKIGHDFAMEGHLRRSDFEQYSATWSKPFSFAFKDRAIHTANHSSLGGLTLALFLKHFEEFSTGVEEPYSLQHFSAIEKAFAATAQTERSYEALSAAVTSQAPRKTGNQIKENGTSHFSIVDENGLAVGITTSLGEGCGYFVPGTNMQLNNMLGEAALQPNGFHTWLPDTRLNSLMTPTIVENNGSFTVFGTGGAGRIPFAIGQFAIYYALWNMSIEQAIEASRIHRSRAKLEVEQGFETTDTALELSLWDKTSMYFGGINAVQMRTDGQLLAHADSRRKGSFLIC